MPTLRTEALSPPGYIYNINSSSISSSSSSHATDDIERQQPRGDPVRKLSKLQFFLVHSPPNSYPPFTIMSHDVSFPSPRSFHPKNNTLVHESVISVVNNELSPK